MKEANKLASDFIKENQDNLALLGLAGICTGALKDTHGVFPQFARFCKENGISKVEALEALGKLINKDS